MERARLDYLKSWLTATDRKPLVIRGARQVGKTWLVRHFAKISGKQLIEINFEKQPSLVSLFASNDPKHILLNLSTVSNIGDSENCILFLDEIQTAPALLSKLRWFAEDFPQLAVIAAGSLLEFTLSEHSFSMPVGRINYMHMEQFSFEEFLIASGKKSLYDYLAQYHLNIAIPSVIHDQLLALFREYILVGGLPAVVSSWVTERSLRKVNQIQHDLLSTYRDDFPKYKGRIAIERLDELIMNIPKMIGQKFVYSRINALVQSATVKQALNLLEKARICHRVLSCSANGIPLAAEVNDKYFKEILIDIGLCNAILGLNLSQINAANEINFINNGGVAEQVVGQILRTLYPPYIEPALYYWHREVPGSHAEIDYVIQHGNRVIPIEVKAGATGSLKSLHFFMGLRKFTTALRINSDLPSVTSVNMKDAVGNPVKYQLISLPFYLTGQINRLLELIF